MEVRIRQHRLGRVSLGVPDAEHGVISKELLERTQNKLSDFIGMPTSKLN
jgi:hypothetical protein